MGWVEVIRLRIPFQEREKTLRELEVLLKNYCRTANGPSKIMALLGLQPGCDIAFVISWPDEFPGTQPSPLASNLSSHLTNYGLVSNSTWIESQLIHWPKPNETETENENIAGES